MNALFISDLHLSEERPHTTAAFFAFLQGQARQCESLYILGDFFDAWIGDDDDRPLAGEVARGLQTLTRNDGPRVYFQHGNRDFLLGEDYARRCGMVLLPELYVLETGSERWLLAHGDQFCTGDTAYQQFRAMVRDPAWQQSFLTKPLVERRAIATGLRARSREANSIKPEDILDVTPAVVWQVMLQFGVTTLIHGHTHRPARHLLDEAGSIIRERVVLGEWDSHFWVARADATGLHLNQHPT